MKSLLLITAVACLGNVSHGFQLLHNSQQIIHPNIHHHPSSSSSSSYTKLQLAAVSPEEVSDKTYDLAVLGAGPVGVSAALLAARSPHNKNVILIDAPRASGALMNEVTGEDLSIGGPTGLFSKALRDTGKRISVSSLKGMGLRDDR